MNRIELQKLSEVRLQESRVLLDAGCPEGAYYLAGYAIECALKACIAKRTQLHDFPEKKTVNDSYTHDLAKLLQLAELKVDLDTAVRADSLMDAKWATIQQWSEESRYSRRTAAEAEELLQAIQDSSGGLLPWIRVRW